MPERSKAKVILTDTSCFIILHKLNALHILNDLFDTVLTTPEVVKEFGQNLPKWVLIQTIKNIKLQEYYNRHIDAGEASVIALSFETDYDHLILDDAAARKFAEGSGLSVKETLGLLLSAKQQNIIPLIRPYVDLIQQSNFRISQSLIDNIISNAGEY